MTLSLRAGVAHDKTPTRDDTRTLRLLDQGRTWVTMTLQYLPWNNGTLEFADAHEFLKNASISTPAAPGSNWVGSFKDQADIISIRYSHSFWHL